MLNVPNHQKITRNDKSKSVPMKRVIVHRKNTHRTVIMITIKRYMHIWHECLSSNPNVVYLIGSRLLRILLKVVYLYILMKRVISMVVIGGQTCMRHFLYISFVPCATCTFKQSPRACSPSSKSECNHLFHIFNPILSNPVLIHPSKTYITC